MGDSVFVNKRSVIHKGSAGKSVAFPDVNLCPPTPPAGPVPVPLPNVAQAADLQGGATSVLVEGNPMAKRSSFFARSQGNAIARTTGGGVVTHIVEGAAHFVSYSFDVVVEGEEVPRHLDLMTHNHAAPSPPNAAMGTYVGVADVAAIPASPIDATKRPKPRKPEPQSVEVFLHAPGGQPANPSDRFLLVSHDRKYSKEIPASAAIPQQDLLCIRFPKVLPGKRYSLYTLMNDEKIPFFEDVPFALIAVHTPGAEKTGTVEKRKADATEEGARKPDRSRYPADWYSPDPREKK